VDLLCATSWLYRFLAFSSDQMHTPDIANTGILEHWPSCGGDTWDYSGSTPGLTHWYDVTCHDTAEFNSNRPLSATFDHLHPPTTTNLPIPAAISLLAVGRVRVLRTPLANISSRR
jgi:hypothetical protein